MPPLKAVLTPEEKRAFKTHFQARGATEAGVRRVAAFRAFCP